MAHRHKIYLARNDRAGSMFYDMKLFGENQIAEASEYVKLLNKLGPKGWNLKELERE